MHQSISNDYRWALGDELGFITVTQTFNPGCKFWHPAISMIIISAKGLLSLSFFFSYFTLFWNWALEGLMEKKNSVHNQWHSLSNDWPYLCNGPFDMALDITKSRALFYGLCFNLLCGIHPHLVITDKSKKTNTCTTVWLDLLTIQTQLYWLISHSDHQIQHNYRSRMAVGSVGNA